VRRSLSHHVRVRIDAHGLRDKRGEH
jgi:hypothetical protein